MTIVILGASGQLGAEFARQLGHHATPLSRADLDIAHTAELRRRLEELAPRVVINAAAYTRVDRAEEEPRWCRTVNTTAVANLAELCRQSEATLVQISTDYVFGAKSDRRLPYREEDEPGPLSVYGRTKLDAERQAATCQRYLVLRTCGLYGWGRDNAASNFVETILRWGAQKRQLSVVDDQFCTPTFTRDVVRATAKLLDADATGVFHVVNRGSTTWYEFASEIVKLAGLPTTIKPISTREYAARAQRPAYSVLDTGKYTAVTGDELPDWREALADYLNTRPDGRQ
jgi:dTDP-4-dehydrorhamnose reductase